MTTDEARATLRKELQQRMFEISQMEILQSKKAELVYNALEEYRQVSNRLRIKEEQEEQKRIQAVLAGWKSDKKTTDVSTKEYFKKIRKAQTQEHLKSLVGTEKFQEFIEKFVKEHKK